MEARVASSIPGSVEYISPVHIEPTITWVPLGFSIGTYGLIQKLC